MMKTEYETPMPSLPTIFLNNVTPSNVSKCDS